MSLSWCHRGSLCKPHINFLLYTTCGFVLRPKPCPHIPPIVVTYCCVIALCHFSGLCGRYTERSMLYIYILPCMLAFFFSLSLHYPFFKPTCLNHIPSLLTSTPSSLSVKHTHTPKKYTMPD